MACGENQQLVVFSSYRRRRRSSPTSSCGYELLQQQLVVLAADAAISFMMLWAAGLTKLLVRDVLRWDERPEGVVLMATLNLGHMMAFAWIGQDITGGNLNPVSVLSDSFSCDGNAGILFAVLGRIPAQVIGALTGVRLIKAVFPSIGSGPRLNVGIHHGALAEGFMTFTVVIISLMLKKRDPTSFFMRTWISSLSKMTLHILGSDLTGGIMNPASAFGWAYARGDHITIEHLLVYWLAPLQATLLGVWTFKLLTEPSSMKAKSE